MANLLRAKSKCWVAKDMTTVVEDGSPEAYCLLARKGEMIRRERLGKYKNAAEFFDEINPKPKSSFDPRNRGDETSAEGVQGDGTGEGVAGDANASAGAEQVPPRGSHRRRGH